MQEKQYNKEICDKWFLSKNINPITLRKIKDNGPVYKTFLKNCSLDQKVKLTKQEICDKWFLNKNINPITLRKIKDNGPVYKTLSKICPLNKINSKQRKVNAAKKIYKLFMPYIKRSSYNIIDRINYFIIIKNYLLKIKETNNCLRLYNIDKKTNEPIYRIGNRIILDKQLGLASNYGIVFLSHFKTDGQGVSRFDRLNKFAVKITEQTNANKIELEILKKLTRYVVELKCPHFPISYGYLKCNNTEDYSIIKANDKNLFPEMINENLYIQLNELASGDLRSILMQPNPINIKNIISQILLTLMFFHNYTNNYHCDTHTGNFLYHKIKSGGYFHYNIYGKDYFLENTGYLWVIWNFELMQPLTQKHISINIDFIYILNRINYYNNRFTNEENLINKLLYKKLITHNDKPYNSKLLKKMNKDLLNILVENYSSFTTIKPSNIINKKPYII